MGDEAGGFEARHAAAVRPADRVTLALLAAIVALLLVRWLGGVPLGAQVAGHGALLAAFAGLVVTMARSRDAAWVPYARGLAVVAVMFTLYGSLGHLAFAAIPWRGDPWLAAADRVLGLGHAPSLWAERFVTPGRVAFFSFVYALFIPYLYLSILLGLVGRPDRERDEFLTGFALLYALAFTGYVLVPAHGPIVQHAAEFRAPLPGGLLHGLVTASVERVGGPHGAFPSLHLGASVFACRFDLKYNLLRGVSYLPVVALIAAATVLLRYHYVVDLAAGAACAVVAGAVAARWGAGPREAA
jgi:PAP2 superfamily